MAGTLLIAAPAAEPVTLAEQKSHSRVEFADEDVLIGGLIKTARECVEMLTNRKLITQRWRVYLDELPPDGIITLPFAPVSAVEFVRFWDANAVGTVLSATTYYADVMGEPARILPKDNWQIPSAEFRRANGIEVGFGCGYGAAGTNVPESLRQAVRFLAAHWYENRIAVSDAANVRFEELPMGVQYLLAPYRLWGRAL
ncbi:MAG: head-tail connector protein [Elusimicrobiales bacterium]